MATMTMNDPIPGHGFTSQGYNPRVFIPTVLTFYEEGRERHIPESQRFHGLLKSHCLWGDWDKRWTIDGIEHYGYEIPERDWEVIQKVLIEAGMTLQPIGMRNRIDN
mgnify:CR=1 FL=1